MGMPGVDGAQGPPGEVGLPGTPGEPGQRGDAGVAGNPVRFWFPLPNFKITDCTWLGSGTTRISYQQWRILQFK